MKSEGLAGRQEAPSSPRRLEALRGGHPREQRHRSRRSSARPTDPAHATRLTRARLGPAIDAGIAATISDAELRTHPLAVWVETCSGCSPPTTDPGGTAPAPWHLTEAARSSASTPAATATQCPRRCATLLLRVESARARSNRRLAASASRASSPSSSTSSSRARATPSPRWSRRGSAGHGRRAAVPPGRARASASTPRTSAASAARSITRCGSSHSPRTANAGSCARDIDDAPPTGAPTTPRRPGASDEANDSETFGFLTLQPRDAGFTFHDHDADYPEAWLDNDAAGEHPDSSASTGGPRGCLRVAPDGTVGSGRRMWFLPGKFRFCLRCGDHPQRSPRATAPASPRSPPRVEAPRPPCSSAACCAGCTARLALPPDTRKLLGFTDNRQDAALQAGHFNDFLFVSLVRAGFLGALDAAGEEGCRAEQLGARAAARPRLRPALPGTSRRVAASPGLKGINASRPRRPCARCWPTASGSTSGEAGATPTPTSSSSASSR
jgi:hypothetical protein